jgi:uncharacterized membrane protein
MLTRFSHFLDNMSEFLAARKGLLPILGILMIIINGVIQFIPGVGWLASTNLILHIGLVLALVGIMLAWAL